MKSKSLRLIRLNTENSFHAPDSSVRFLGKAVAPPLGLLTVASIFEKNGYLVTVVDEELDKVDWQAIPEDLVGISGMLHNYERLVRILEELRKTSIITMIGGSITYDCPEELAKLGTIVVAGEFEALAPNLIRDLEAGSAKGVYRTSVVPPHSEGIPPILPAFHLVEMKRYVYGTVQTQRGCPNSCSFCQIPHWFGHKIRTKPPAAVIKELASQIKQGTTFFVISDDNFIADPQYANELLDEIISYQEKNNLKLHFFTQIAIDVAQYDEMLRKMRTAGFFWMFIGLESGKRDALIEVKKHRNLELDVVQAVKKIHAQGISVFGAFIVGLDGDDASCFDQLFEYAQQLGIPAVQVKQACAIKGTELYEKMLALDRVNLRAPPSAAGGLDESNLIFKNIPIPEMNARHLELFRRLYSPKAFYSRVRTFVADIKDCRAEDRIESEFTGHPFPVIFSTLCGLASRMKFGAFYHFLRSLFHAWRLHGFSRSITAHVLRFALYHFAVDNWITARGRSRRVQDGQC